MLSWSLCCLWDPFPDGNYLGNNAGTPGHCYTFAVGNNVPSTYYGTARGTAGNAPLNAPGNAIGNNAAGGAGNNNFPVPMRPGKTLVLLVMLVLLLIAGSD